MSRHHLFSSHRPFFTAINLCFLVSLGGVSPLAFGQNVLDLNHLNPYHKQTSFSYKGSKTQQAPQQEHSNKPPSPKASTSPPPIPLRDAPSAPKKPPVAQPEISPTPTAANGTFQSSSASEISVDSDSITVREGTALQITFMTPMDSRITQVGEGFLAQLTEDFMDEQKRVILPAGSVLRGRVDDLKRPGLFSRGGSIDLNFHHVVMPSGDLLPIDLKLSADNTGVNHKGELYSDPGVGFKIRKGAEAGGETFEKIKTAGFSTQGPAKIITIPGSLAVGAAGAAAVTTGKAVQALVGKGESVVIRPGDKIIIQFSKDGLL